ncbi:MAG: hypothetical protein P8011_01615 [Acidihalobacter sp.]|uniref:hypothetical protein n=1 Tax=Acidihalobacter sp. TaxID=1872108 RepID=UPI00307E1859
MTDLDQNQINAIETDEGKPDALAQAIESGRKMERERILRLLDEPEARGRIQMAIHIALHHPDMSFEMTKAMLSKAPREIRPDTCLH